jgi:hypothetical protein
MNRKLLPYEHDLIKMLGISKEEYLEFVALQKAYSDPKEGTVLDARNWEVVAIVLTVIGTVFQVVSALIAPKPEIPQVQDTAVGQRQTREQRFSPRFGFNSAQELGKYGDPVPLVYADQTVNPNGGVRIAGSLLWSAVRSFGSSQFLQMLMMLSGGQITAIDFERSAFGQTVITDLIAQNRWIYFKTQGTGILSFGDEVAGDGDEDPTKYGSGTSDVYALELSPGVFTEGFSQAYSPSSSNAFGIYSPVPLGVVLYLRDEQGNKNKTGLGIKAELPGWSDAPSEPLNPIAQGATLKVIIATTKDLPVDDSFSSDLKRASGDARRTLASSFDDSGIFKLGSAKFKIKKVVGTSTDEDRVIAELTCTEPGHAPSTPYNYDERNDFRSFFDQDPDYKASKKTYENLIKLDDRNQQDTIQFLGVPDESQNFVIDSVESLLKSGQIWELVTIEQEYKIPPNKNWNSERTATRFVSKFYKLRDITKAEKAALRLYKSYKDALQLNADDRYFIKAVSRYEEATYTTLASSDIIYLSLRCQVFRRIAGRQRVYGSKQVKGYPESDNGVKQRTAIFMLRYRKAGAAEWLYAPGFYAVRRAAEQDNFVYLKFKGNEFASWQFRLEPVIDPISEVKTHPQIQSAREDGSLTVFYHYLQNSPKEGEGEQTLSLGEGNYLYFTGFSQESKQGFTYPLPPLNKSPRGTNEWDLFSLDADTDLTASFDRGPEFVLSAVTEQQLQAYNRQTLYRNLSLIGFNVFSGKSLQDMRSFSTHVTQGKPVRRINVDTKLAPSEPDGPSCYAPDIFLDTVYDTEDGIGKYAVIDAIDVTKLAEAKRFCIKNKLFMDCLIADPGNWRQFWVSSAPYSLLEFARINGRETLVPSVPFNSLTGEITRDVAISALFNQGNIIEDSYKEEFMDYDSNVQDVIATGIYRATEPGSAFAVNKSVAVKLQDAKEVDCVRQTFDLSAFVTTEEQTILFLKLICNLRRHVRSAIEFKTFPTTTPVFPGAYIYVDVGFNAWQGVRTGVVEADGYLNAPLDNSIPPDTNFSALLYRSDRGVVSLTNVRVQNNRSAQLVGYEGHLFVLGEQVTSKRVYRVSDVQMDEEGEVTIRATIFPCDSQGKALISNFQDELFSVTR